MKLNKAKSAKVAHQLGQPESTELSILYDLSEGNRGIAFLHMDLLRVIAALTGVAIIMYSPRLRVAGG